MRSLLLVLMVCAVGALGGLGVPAPAALANPVAGAASAAPGVNLLIDPGAETGLCSTSGHDAMTLPGWSVLSGSPNAICYGTPGFAPADPARGHAYFSGGAAGDSAMAQRVDVSSSAAAIDTGGVRYDLSGALGGLAGQNDRVRVSAKFLDGSGMALSSTELPVVTNTDRHLTSGLWPRATTGSIPPGTRAIDVVVEFLWTAGDTTDAYADDLALHLSTPVTLGKLAAPGSNVPSFDHVFFVFMENENFAASEAASGRGDYVVGNPAAPYLNKQLARQGSLLGSMYATGHPSDPNYLAVSGGSTFGYQRDLAVGTDKVHAVHVGDRLDAAGKTWAGYAGGMSYPCDMTTHNTDRGGYYQPDGEPFMLYADVTADRFRCAAHNKPLEQLPLDLSHAETTPNLVWFAANNWESMDAGGVAAGDRWLSRVLPVIFQSPAWTTQRSLLIVSWDEGRGNAFGPDYPNHVATYVVGSQATVKAGYVSPLRYTDYSLGATICDALGIAPMTSNDKYANRLSDIWQTNSGGSSSQGIA